jgi:Zn-dependent peptidase ImmA (M78 family)
MNKEQLLKKVDDSFKKHGGIDVVGLANEMSIVVHSEGMSDDQASTIRHDAESKKFIITVNNNQTKERQRFSVAHEIAHFILHRDDIVANSIVAREGHASLDIKRERDADSLAADILMPQKYIDSFLMGNGITRKTPIINGAIIVQTATRFGVSRPACIVRLRDIGYYVRYI